MKKRLSWGAALSLMIIVVAVTVCVTMLVAMRRFNNQVNELSNRQAMYSYVSDVDNAVRQNFYGTIDEERLSHALAAGEAAGLNDPYAAFLDTGEYSALLTRLSGQNTGFGLEVALNESGQVVVGAVQVGSTAYSAGMQKGDVITALNKVAFTDDPLGTVQNALNTSATVLLSVKRDGKETAFELSSSAFTRVCVDSTMVGDVGYIRVKDITDATPEQLKSAYSSLKEQGATGAVLDLRGIVDGSPEAAKKMLSFLLPYGLYGYYTDNNGTVELRAEESTVLDMPAAVLVNKKTAGEAELVAAALRQAGVATLVGNTTGGRSRVQACFALPADNAAVRITVGEFQLLDKTGWEGKGLTPDVEASLTEEQEQALDLLTPETDTQLQAALNALSGGETTTTTTTTTPTTTTTATETTATEAETTTTAAE